MINFSVVIPCYNSEKTIDFCIESIFSQTYFPKEIIVVDDGSQDNTLLKLDILKKKCPPSINFIIITQPNSGPSKARNQGVQRASCQWIAFLDSDDYWPKDNLKVAKTFIAKNENYALVGGGKYKSDFQKITFKKLLLKNYFKPSVTLVKRDWILKYPFNEKQKYSEDYRSALLIAYEAPACVVNNYMAPPVIARKNTFSGGGLSSKLWEMEKGELSNYWFLRKHRKISLFTFAFISSISLLKYLRRLIKKK